ncbi:Sec-independent protein translocase protein TatB [Hyphomicrobium sp. D-2]|uniref:Sec-independent protein translocase protein TatB n=1 Tax=Hyphomicrobium sp. D-2 TaxID=3041621 RepID=UPI0024570AD2|nr:Sec-independent protein translocase protein TatB [Hyphomicrobium sp. D-2]MDH4982271.1 Sec-independent protein translocase protein TatB [Hyphomicrobium sp. D-2]
MFDLTSSKLLILAVVALIVVGPKDLPILLRTIGKYLGLMRQQAAEFRRHFDEAVRDAELGDLKREFDSVANEVRATMQAGSRAIDQELQSVDKVANGVGTGASVSAAPTASRPALSSDGAQSSAGGDADGGAGRGAA